MAALHCRVLEVLLFMFMFAVLILFYNSQPTMFLRASVLLTTLLPVAAHAAVKLSWHAPRQTDINNITAAFEGDGVYGFIYNTSDTPKEQYGTYNWCNMPHVRKTEYVRPSNEYTLKYVEVVGHAASNCSMMEMLNICRSIDITSALHMRAMHFP